MVLATFNIPQETLVKLDNVDNKSAFISNLINDYFQSTSDKKEHISKEREMLEAKLKLLDDKEQKMNIEGEEFKERERERERHKQHINDIRKSILEGIKEAENEANNQDEDK